jgi:hypothetical protein
MTKITLEPLFRKLWILEATTPEEIQAIADSLRNSWKDITEWFRTEDISEEAQKSAEKFNRWEFDDEETKPSIKK